VYNVVSDFGADNTGVVDATSSIQTAIDAARRTNGGTVFLPAGTYRCRRQLNLDASRTIRLEGVGGATGGASPATQLIYTGRASSFISARSAVGFALHRLGIFYNNPAFSGALVDMSHGNQWDSALALISDCVFATAGKSTATAIINLDRVHTSTVRNCAFSGARAAIIGVAAPGHYSNAIQIRVCHFAGTAGPAIQNPGDSWSIEGCTFEARLDGSAGAVHCGLPAQSLSITGCWMGDVTASSASTQIVFSGKALLVQGNMIGGHPATTAIAILGRGNIGADIRANMFDTHATAVDLGAGLSAVQVLDNAYHNVTRQVTGTMPGNGMVQNDKGFGIGVNPLSALHVKGALTIGALDGATSGAGQLLPSQPSPVSVRQTFTTDNTGWQYRIAKNQPGRRGADITDLVAIADSGNVGLGVMNPTYRLHLDSDSAAKPGSSTWSNPSDIRLKHTDSITEFTDGIDVVRQVRPVRYRYNGKAGMPQTEHIGVIAQEIAAAMPYSIDRYRAKLEPGDHDETELLAFNAHALPYVLANAVRELDTRLARLEADNTAKERTVHTI
jgi:hypothetical protein